MLSVNSIRAITVFYPSDKYLKPILSHHKNIYGSNEFWLMQIRRSIILFTCKLTEIRCTYCNKTNISNNINSSIAQQWSCLFLYKFVVFDTESYTFCLAPKTVLKVTSIPYDLVYFMISFDMGGSLRYLHDLAGPLRVLLISDSQWATQLFRMQNSAILFFFN